VPAAARLSTPDSYTNPKQLIRVDGTPIIIHLLKDLHFAGIERVVITLGYAARELREEVTKEEYGGMLVEFVVKIRASILLVTDKLSFWLGNLKGNDFLHH